MVLLLFLLHFLTLSVFWESEETGFINLEKTIKQDCSVTVFSHQGREACSRGSLLPFCLSMKLACWNGLILCGVTTTQQGMQQADGTPLVSNLTCFISSWSHFPCLGPHCSSLGTHPSMCYFR